ncbi:MAG TPA: endopeptidase La [Thermoflexales bacterium]|nr:endopeptidase La [Thermoflexales bacterium]HQW35573.1 endopeptidase La [Thermoflexales bacterium]HQZ23249.1 endopeptidase La [Thermoflexales bacterium]
MENRDGHWIGELVNAAIAAHEAKMINTQNEQAENAQPGDAQSSPEEQNNALQKVAILPLRGILVNPLSAIPLRVAQPRSVKLIDDAMLAKANIGLIASKDGTKEEPTLEDLYDVGTLASIVRMFKSPDGVVNMVVQGIERIRITRVIEREPYIIAEVETLPEPWQISLELEATRRNLIQGFARMAELIPSMPDDLSQMIQGIEDPRQLMYAIATYMRMELGDAQKLLEMNGLPDKMLFLLQLVNKELEVLELGKKIQTEATSEMEKVQREYFLREQIRAIQRELGEADEQQMDAQEFRARIEASGMNDEARKEAMRELDRLAKLPTQAAEYGVIRTYLDWMTSLPWKVATPDSLEIQRARNVLDEDHYGLKDIKDRILEFLAVRKRRQELAAEKSAAENTSAEKADVASGHIRPEREGVILCFVGPPGVGKTSLGASIARAMGRKFIRISLGGVRDEAEIRGFRRTYIGSMPGRIIQSIRRAESNNPVFMLDEVDKMGSDFRGDPSSALLEVLDPEQNREFRDHYLDVPFDLSQTIFVCTANTLETIPGPLRDRMEILQLSGYTEKEKLNIAQGYLVPRQIKENGMRPDEITFSADALLQLMRDFTREAGVRNLEREIGAICRKLLTRYYEDRAAFPVAVGKEKLTELLGKPKYYFEAAERTEMPGVATGLVWTPVGGDVVFIEATLMRGGKGFMLTGQLGDVMRESAQAALSYVRSRAKDLGLDDTVFEKHDIHLHVPAGAQPKDGPSAGVTIAAALASLLTGRLVKPDVAMTGEITLRGLVLPVGGIKEKILAAHRVGMKTVIIPRRNEADLDELPPEVRQSLNIILVDRVQQVWDAALSITNDKLRITKTRKAKTPAKRKTVRKAKIRN